jgi:acetolactate synthase I/II/III large subunit
MTSDATGKIRAADMLVKALVAYGVDRVFCVPGESYLPLLDAIHDRPEIDLIVTRHEGGAGFMAVADAKCTGRPGICLVSRGPGAMNAAIAVHTAQQDAVPLILIVGQVGTSERGRGAFQEVDYAKTFSDMAKDVWEVSQGSRLAETFARAWSSSTSGTPGPVVLAIAEDAFSQMSSDERVTVPTRIESEPGQHIIDAVARLLGGAQRPILIAGGALGSVAGRSALAIAAQAHHLPVVLSYKHQDLFDNRDPLYGGYLGFKIPKPQVAQFREADLVLAVGTRLTDVTTQNYRFPRAPQPDQVLIHVYPDPSQLGRVFRADRAIATDPVQFLLRLAERHYSPTPERFEWSRRLKLAVDSLAAYDPKPRSDGIEFGTLVSAVCRRASRDAVLCVDAGNFSGWVHRLWPMSPTNLLIGTVGGAMGIGVPGGITAALRFPQRQVITFVGDGGLMMTGAELATAAQYKARLAVFVATNGTYGTIRQHQEIAYPGRISGTDLYRVDVKQFATACGALGLAISTLDDIDGAVEEALAHTGPVVVDVNTSVESLSAYMTLTQARERGHRSASKDRAGSDHGAPAGTPGSIREKTGPSA